MAVIAIEAIGLVTLSFKVEVPMGVTSTKSFKFPVARLNVLPSSFVIAVRSLLLRSWKNDFCLNSLSEPAVVNSIKGETGFNG